MTTATAAVHIPWDSVMVSKIPRRASLCAVACAGGIALGACGDSAGVDAADRFVQVAAGARHACALTAVGRAFCWGTNEFGQLGNPTYTSSALPVPTEATPPLASLSAGFNHTCAVSRDGRVYCWGSNGSGELGDGTRTARPIPTPVRSTTVFRAVSAGEAHTCAVADDGAGYCWGAPLGAIPGLDGRPPDVLQPERLGLPTLAALGAGYEIACAVTAQSGATYCWGQYPPGVALDSGESSRGLPQLIAPAPALASVSAGFKHACGLGAGGMTYCWGWNASGQTGVGAIGDTVASPTAVTRGWSAPALPEAVLS